MTHIEQLKIKSELLRVQSAKAELEYIREQRHEEIKRIEENILKQEETEKSLLERLNNHG
jgi:hypothetical protein